MPVIGIGKHAVDAAYTPIGSGTRQIERSHRNGPVQCHKKDVVTSPSLKTRAQVVGPYARAMCLIPIGIHRKEGANPFSYWRGQCDDFVLHDESLYREALPQEMISI
jgi:hypothetical protein